MTFVYKYKKFHLHLQNICDLTINNGSIYPLDMNFGQFLAEILE